MEHGSTQLADWIDRRYDGIQAAAARDLGVNKSVINKILKRTRLPGRLIATLLRDEAGIPLDAWVPTRVKSKRQIAHGKKDS